MNEELNTYQVLITRMLAGEASVDDRRQLELWLNESAENRFLYEQFKAAWKYKPADMENIHVDRNAAWQKISRGIELADQAGSKQKMKRIGSIRRISYYAISGVAAMFLLMLGIYFLLLNQGQTEMLVYHTEKRMDESLTLPDGSLIQLNSNSSLTYPVEFKEKKRYVKLNGQAFFEVAQISGKPFTIELDGAIVTVLGTSFNISQYQNPNNIEVAVISGKVMLQTDDVPPKEIVLTQGEKGIFNKASRELSKEMITNHNFMAWKTGRLEFDQTSLPEVLKTIGETYLLDVVTEQDLSDLKLTARFSDEDPADIFKTIGMLFGLQVDHEQGVYRIRQQ